MNPMHYPFSGRSLLLLAIAAVVLPARSHGVPINFSTSVEFIDSSSIDLSLGEVIYAINAGGTAVPNESVTVGGVPLVFQSLGNAVSVGRVATDFPNMNNAATPADLYATATDQASLDRILDGQAWNDDAAATVTLQELTPGQFYRVQVIGAADTRDCCGDRIHDVHSSEGGTTGFIDRNQDYDSDTMAHVITSIGDFTADATSQQLVFDGVNNAAFSALILTSSSPSAVAHPQITIDRSTGSVTLENTNSQAASSLLGYSLTSAAGSFNQAAWTPIATAYDESGDMTVDPNDDWTVVTTDPTVTTELSEFNSDTPGDAAVFSPLQKIDLGTPWTPSPFEDVSAEITLADSSTQTVDVVYTGTPIAIGDLNGDGTINGSDWTQFKSGFGSPLGETTLVAAYVKGDLDGDLDQDLTDFGIFKQAYDDANGPGAFAAMAAGVPEPGTIVLLGMAAAAAGLYRRRAVCSAAILAVAAVFLIPCRSANAADVNFGASFELVDSNDIDLSFGEFVYAINGAGASQTRVVNLDGFDAVFDPLQGATSVSTTFANFSGGPGGLYEPTTDQTELDAVLNTHTWDDTVSQDVTLLGLQVGASYQVQVIGPADTRECCIARVHSVTGGAGTPGDISRNQDLDLDTVGHVLTTLGAFTADSTSQVLNFSGPDPSAVAGFSGLILTSSSPHGLSLTVDRASGNVTLSNDTPNAIPFDSYQITSAGGSLSPSGWDSLSGRSAPLSGFPQGDGSGNGWEQATTPAASGLAEWFLNPNDALSVSSLGPGESIDLGSVYSSSTDAQDLQFSYRQTDGRVVPRVVSYVGEPSGVVGDYNNDGVVDAADYTVWRDNVGSTNSLPHDPIGGTIGASQYQQWRDHYGESTGGSGASAQAAVPEPTTMVHVLLVSLLCNAAALRTRRF